MSISVSAATDTCCVGKGNKTGFRALLLLQGMECVAVPEAAVALFELNPDVVLPGIQEADLCMVGV